MLQRQISWMAFWAATARTVLVILFSAADITGRLPDTARGIYESVCTVEFWIVKQISNILTSTPGNGVFALLIAGTVLAGWMGAFAIVYIVLQIAALLVRPKRTKEIAEP